jgi:hypothetical protein
MESRNAGFYTTGSNIKRCVMAINELIVDFYSTILGGPFANLVVAVIILLLGFIIGRIGGRVVKRVLQEIDLDKNAKKAGIKFSIENFSGSLSAYLIYFISIVAALNQFKVVTPVFMILVVGLVIFLVITALLAVKDFVPNMFSGLYIFRTDFIKNGDKIRMKNRGPCLYTKFSYCQETDCKT